MEQAHSWANSRELCLHLQPLSSTADESLGNALLAACPQAAQSLHPTTPTAPLAALTSPWCRAGMSPADNNRYHRRKSPRVSAPVRDLTMEIGEVPSLDLAKKIWRVLSGKYSSLNEWCSFLGLFCIFVTMKTELMSKRPLQLVSNSTVTTCWGKHTFSFLLDNQMWYF